MSRVVLVIPRRRDIENTARLEYALEQIERGGHEVAAIVDPEQHLDAVRMVLAGMADLVVVSEPEHFPLVQFVAALDERVGGRTRPMLRPSKEQPAEVTPIGRGRRTQIIRRTA